MIRTYGNLGLACLTPEMRANTCGYWYTVTDASTHHTAFRTRAALMFWLEKRGLSLTAELPPQGEHGYQRVEGAYIDAMGWNLPDEYDGLPFLRMSNRDYTEARLTKQGGLCVINYLNPNAERPVWHWRVGTPWEDAGKDGLPPMKALGQ